MLRSYKWIDGQLYKTEPTLPLWGGGCPKYLYSCQCAKMSFIQNTHANLSELNLIISNPEKTRFMKQILLPHLEVMLQDLVLCWYITEF